MIGTSSSGGRGPETGGGGGVGVSTARAEHFIVGFPTVPGGHVQVGR